MKFRFISIEGLGRGVENWFSRFRLWRPCWIFNRLSFIYFLCLLGPHPLPDALLIKFQLNWIIACGGDVRNKISQYFSHINVHSPYKCMRKQIWSCRKKVKRQRSTMILAILVDLPPPMICANIRPQGWLGSGKDFLKILPYMDMAAILVNGPQKFSNRLFPRLKTKLHMKSEQH